jgi:hypothetical protein
MPFGGGTYDRERDHDRLKTQLNDVYQLMQDGEWRTLAEIRKQTGWKHSEAAISARLRDFRKKKFGGHIVDRLYLHDGLFTYRLTVVKTPVVSDAETDESEQ